MKGGGTMLGGGLWVARVKALEPGDCIKCQNFAGGEDNLWMGGEPLMVLSAEPTGLRDGFWYVLVKPTEYDGGYMDTRQLAIRPEDTVCIVSREVAEVKVPKQPKTKKPKKGEQLKLF